MSLGRVIKNIKSNWCIFGHNAIGCLIEQYINMGIFFFQIFMYVNLSKQEFSYNLRKFWLKKSLVPLLFFYVLHAGIKLKTRLTRAIFRSSHQRCSMKKVFLNISQNSQENTFVGVSFLKKLKNPAQVFYSEFCAIFKNIIFYRAPPGDCFLTLCIFLLTLLN